MKEKIDLALICCYNSEEQLKELLLKSYYEQNVECEIVLVDNRENTYSSCAKALNYGASIAKSNYLVFIHQDMVFLDDNQLNNFYTELVQCNGILGVAGVKENEKIVFSSIIHGMVKENAGLRKSYRKNRSYSYRRMLIWNEKRNI